MYKEPQLITVRLCLHCGKVMPNKKITPTGKKNGEGKYCSYDCKWQYQSKQIEHVCVICGSKFKAKLSRIKARFCSRKCKDCWHKTLIPTPEHRGKLSVALKGKQKSPEHKAKMIETLRRQARYGKDSPAWKGGVTKAILLIRGSALYRDWRKSVFQRDNYTCVWCGARCGNGRSVYLEADHLKPFSLIIKQNKLFDTKSAVECKELWDVKNGRTLCRECHKLTDTYKTKANNYATT